MIAQISVVAGLIKLG